MLHNGSARQLSGQEHTDEYCSFFCHLAHEIWSSLRCTRRTNRVSNDHQSSLHFSSNDLGIINVQQPDTQQHSNHRHCSD
jgi:hypothetical protein